MKKVAVVGLGYVGLPTLVAIAKSQKYQTVGFDISQEKIDLIKKGHDPISDPDVTEYLKFNKLKVSTDPNILKNTDFFLIAVPTPVDDEYTPNYGPVKGAMRLVAKYLKKGAHVILESTVNPGTSEEIVLPILEKNSQLKAGVDFNLAHCPERINPGDKKWNIYNIPRNVGSIDPELNQEVASFYRSFLPKALINEVSSLKVAEATKIVENTFRDINIAYVNELAQSFDAMGIDLYETLQGASNKPFGFLVHWPGCGVGGHCIAVDPYYLIKRASLSGFDHRFLKLAREINNFMPEYTVRRLMDALNDLGSPLKDTPVTLLGLSYKANVADLRESPSLEIGWHLLEKEANLTVFDPLVKDKPSELKKAKQAKNLKEALAQAKAVILTTAHDEFIKNLPKLLKNSNVKVVVDGRNCLDKKAISQLGIIYKGIGH